MSDLDDTDEKSTYSSIAECWRCFTFLLGTPARQAESKITLREKLIAIQQGIQTKRMEINRMSIANGQFLESNKRIFSEFYGKSMPLYAEKQRRENTLKMKQITTDIAQLEEEIRVSEGRCGRYGGLLQYDQNAEEELMLKKLANRAGLNTDKLTTKQKKAHESIQDHQSLLDQSNASLIVDTNNRHPALDSFATDEPTREELEFLQTLENTSKKRELDHVHRLIQEEEKQMYSQQNDRYTIEIDTPNETKTTLQQEIEDFDTQ